MPFLVLTNYVQKGEVKNRGNDQEELIVSPPSICQLEMFHLASSQYRIGQHQLVLTHIGFHFSHHTHSHKA